MVNPYVMSFKLNLKPVLSFALPTTHVIYVSGRDAGVFLQAQLMNDVTALSNGQWQYTGWLNPQGRVLALFQLLKLSDEQFVIVLSGLDSEWLIDNLKRFIFRSKVSFSAMPDLYASGEILAANTSLLSESEFNGDIQSQLSINLPGKLCQRRLHLSHIPAESNAHAHDQWHCLDMALGWPYIDNTLQNLWTPQMLSLQTLNAFSLKKGCYPGQEIVARTHYLGKSKRHLVCLSGQQLANGHAILQNGQEVGKVVNANQTGEFAIAVLPVQLKEDAGIENTAGTLEMISF
jgi:folate-binding protein YgfZ